METEDGLPATKGDLRALTTSFEARLDATNARIDASLAQLAENTAEIKKMRLEMKSNRTGVEQDGPIIPAADTVVEEETHFSLFSQAILRHKGRRVRVMLVLKNSKKRV